MKHTEILVSFIINNVLSFTLLLYVSVICYSKVERYSEVVNCCKLNKLKVSHNTNILQLLNNKLLLVLLIIAITLRHL